VCVFAGELVASRGVNLQGWNDGFNGDANIPMARSEFRNKEVRVNSWINAKQHSGPSNTYKMANDGYKVSISCHPKAKGSTGVMLNQDFMVTRRTTIFEKHGNPTQNSVVLPHKEL
jgi:lipopolysaccharide biosynthesis protein